jgi:hypothetical protein
MFGHKNHVVFIVFTSSLVDEVVVPVCPNKRGYRIHIAQEAMLVGAKGGALQYRISLRALLYLFLN